MRMNCNLWRAIRMGYLRDMISYCQAFGWTYLFIDTFVLPINVLILKLTHRIWNREISRILCDAYSNCIITGEQLHLLTSKFDPTQQHEVYK